MSVLTIARRQLKVIALCIIAGAVALRSWPIATESLLRQAHAAKSHGDLNRALALATRVIERDPQSLEGLLLAGFIANKMGNTEKELEYCRRIPESAGGLEVADRLKSAGQAALRCGRASDAEYFYRRAGTLLPDDQMIHRRLGTLLLGEARRWESAPHLLALVKGMSFTLEELAFLGNADEVYDAEKMIAFFEQSVPDDLIPSMGRARLKIFQLSLADAEAILQQILSQQSDFLEARVQLGVVLMLQARHEELLDWANELTPAMQRHPDTWWVLGKRAREIGDTQGAIRCAWETLRLEPNHLSATYLLAQLLPVEGHPTEGQYFLQRATNLEILASTIHELLLRSPTSAKMLRCAQACEDLGRLWEAWAWHVSIETYHPDDVIPGERSRLRSLLTAQTPQTLPDHDLARKIDLSSFSMPNWMKQARSPSSISPDSLPDVRFEDVTISVGLDFCYENGAKAAERGFTIYQSIGGGVAAIDFDQDGSPDLFFPQASDLPPQSTGIEAADRLYRNVRGRCVDISSFALPVDSAYGFGAAVGDFDGDGFPDLYVGNAGRNRLLRNNGDGVFQDVTDTAGICRSEWTTSCLIADINGDGLPDLYDVNYCGGRRPFEHVCLHKTLKRPTTCIPTEFVAASDDLLLNLGDGRFEAVTERAGIQDRDGRGLGIVAANLDDVPGLDLYVANDLTANYLFLNRTPSPGDCPRFDERGILTGTAFDSDARAQASMGIAADDVDQDGLIDLFVTNFFNESNTLYRQQTGSVFNDATREFALHAPSIAMLGFGTQFMDADLDGRPDLVLVNGHVDDYTEIGIPFRMRHQFFVNRGTSFIEVPPTQLGPFFSRNLLGRGLARLDWNRDGLDDFAVSHLIDPASLVLNRSHNVGRYISIRLAGKAYRDAIGSEVTVVSGQEKYVKQLVAGDGFESSNERRLLFGLGKAKSIDEIRVHWPTGDEHRYVTDAINCDVLIVEGSDRVLMVSKE